MLESAQPESLSNTGRFVLASLFVITRVELTIYFLKRLRSKKSSIDHGGRKHARKSSKRSVSSKISASFNEADLTPAKDSSSSHMPSRVSGRLRAKDSGQANLSKQALSTSSSEHQPTPPPIPERRGNEGDDEDEEEGEMNEDSAASEAATPSSSKSAKLSTMLSHSHDKESSLSRQICDRANKPEEGPKSSGKSKKVDDIDETTSPDLDHSPCDGGILTRSRKRKLSLDKPPPFSPEWKCSKRSGGSSLPLPGNCPESEKEQQQQHQPSRKVPGNRSDSSGNQKPASSTSSASSSSSTSEPNFFFDGGHKASITFKVMKKGFCFLLT